MDVEGGVGLLPHALEVGVDGVGGHGAEGALQQPGEVVHAVRVVRETELPGKIMELNVVQMRIKVCYPISWSPWASPVMEDTSIS